jgi:hypothetical protein
MIEMKMKNKRKLKACLVVKTNKHQKKKQTNSQLSILILFIVERLIVVALNADLVDVDLLVDGVAFYALIVEVDLVAFSALIVEVDLVAFSALIVEVDLVAFSALIVEVEIDLVAFFALIVEVVLAVVAVVALNQMIELNLVDHILTGVFVLQILMVVVTQLMVVGVEVNHHRMIEHWLCGVGDDVQ